MSNTHSVSAEQAVPTLQPPGAGIPALERLVGGTIFALRRRLLGREAFTREFEIERRQIAGLYEPLSPELRAKRVLIPRLRGLEDSSRFWSVLMTLDHLRIVNTQIGDAVVRLCRGEVPPRPASTAAVKPSEHVGPEVVAAYEHSCDQYLGAVGACSDLNTRARYAHPWFGPLNAAGWHAMAAMHMGIHRAQVKRIIAGLPV